MNNVHNEGRRHLRGKDPAAGLHLGRAGERALLTLFESDLLLK